MQESNQLAAEQQNVMKNLKRTLIILGAVLLFIGLYITAFMIPDALRALSGPQSMTLAQAAGVAQSERTYASITDGDWQCQTLREVRGLSSTRLRYGRLREVTRYTEVFFTDNTEQVVMLVTLSGEVGCNDLTTEKPTGYLYAMNDDVRQELTNDVRLARYINTQTFLEFCGYCGRDNSLIGAVFGVSFMLLGIGLIVFGRSRRLATLRKQAPQEL